MDIDELFKRMRKERPRKGRYWVDRRKVYLFIEKLNEYFKKQEGNDDIVPAVFKIEDLREYFNYSGKMRLSVTVENMIKKAGYIIRQANDELEFLPKKYVECDEYGNKDIH